MSPYAVTLDRCHCRHRSAKFSLERQTGAVQILVVDDEPAVRDSLERALRLEGYEIALAADGAEALAALASDAAGRGRARRDDAARRRPRGVPPDARGRRPHPGPDADRARRGLRPRRGPRRGRRRLPRQAVRARRAARAAARAAAPPGAGAAGQVLRFADLDARPRVAPGASAASAPIELTRTEFALLELFLLHPRQVLTRSVIFDRVWGYDFGPGSNSLEVYVELPAAQDRGRRRAAAAAHRARRRLRAARGMSLGLRAGLRSSRACGADRVVVPPAARAAVGGGRRGGGRARIRDRVRGRPQRAARRGRQPAAATWSAGSPCPPELLLPGTRPPGQNVLVLPSRPARQPGRLRPGGAARRHGRRGRAGARIQLPGRRAGARRRAR